MDLSKALFTLALISNTLMCIPICVYALEMLFWSCRLCSHLSNLKLWKIAGILCDAIASFCPQFRSLMCQQSLKRSLLNVLCVGLIFFPQYLKYKAKPKSEASLYRCRCGDLGDAVKHQENKKSHISDARQSSQTQQFVQDCKVTIFFAINALIGIQSTSKKQVKCQILK